MGVVVDWTDAEKKIIRYDFPGEWTWDDLYAAMNRVNEMMATVPYNVYIVISFEHSRGVFHRGR